MINPARRRGIGAFTDRLRKLRGFCGHERCHAKICPVEWCTLARVVRSNAPLDAKRTTQRDARARRSVRGSAGLALGEVIGVGAGEDGVGDGVLGLVEHGHGEGDGIRGVLLGVVGAAFGLLQVAFGAVLVALGA
jgi:hypothetical protein